MAGMVNEVLLEINWQGGISALKIKKPAPAIH
jgi:hypothetical protein